MRITNEQMQQYVGGQLEMIGGDIVRLRGQISKIEVVPDEYQEDLGGQPDNLNVEFEYICQLVMGQGYRPIENKSDTIPLSIYAIGDIGNDRIAMTSQIGSEMYVFYPPTHHKRMLADGSFEIDFHGS